MLAVYDVNVTSTAHVMTADRGSKAASVVLSPAQTGLRLHGLRLSGPHGTPRHHGSRQSPTAPQRAPRGVGGAPLIHTGQGDCGRGNRPDRAVAVPVGGWF